MTKGELAYNLFLEGYNCSQAVVCAFCDEVGLDRETALKLASSFGGGMGRMREVCGAVSGMFMVAGLVCGYSDPKDKEAKRRHYELIQKMAKMFSECNGSIICRELLSGVKLTPGAEPTPRNDGFYKKRPCQELVRCAAEIADEVLFHNK